VNRPHLGDNWPWALVCVPAVLGLTVWVAVVVVEKALGVAAGMGGVDD
jgi:hypothetical protein